MSEWRELLVVGGLVVNTWSDAARIASALARRLKAKKYSDATDASTDASKMTSLASYLTKSFLNHAEGLHNLNKPKELAAKAVHHSRDDPKEAIENHSEALKHHDNQAIGLTQSAKAIREAMREGDDDTLGYYELPRDDDTPESVHELTKQMQVAARAHLAASAAHKRAIQEHSKTLSG